MNQFESTITSIRNILRVEGITGLDSINHCVALLVSRYLTIEKVKEIINHILLVINLYVKYGIKTTEYITNK